MYSCNPAGHPQTDTDTGAVKISDKVERMSKAGAFGCPGAKADMGFPEPSVSLYDLYTKTQGLEIALSEARASSDASRALSISGIVIALIGLVAGIGAWIKSRKI